MKWLGLILFTSCVGFGFWMIARAVSGADSLPDEDFQKRIRGDGE